MNTAQLTIEEIAQYCKLKRSSIQSKIDRYNKRNQNIITPLNQKKPYKYALEDLKKAQIIQETDFVETVPRITAQTQANTHKNADSTSQINTLEAENRQLREWNAHIEYLLKGYTKLAEHYKHLLITHGILHENAE